MVADSDSASPGGFTAPGVLSEIAVRNPTSRARDETTFSLAIHSPGIKELVLEA